MESLIAIITLTTKKKNCINIEKYFSITFLNANLNNYPESYT